jgi:AbiV family abortive infection protein
LGDLPNLKNKNILTIPLKSVAEGVELCLDNATQFCSDAKALVEISSCQHALGLCIYAIEELGKATLLKEMAAYATKRNEDNITLERTKSKD